MWSATRSACAMIVSPGLTAADEGKNDASTTKRLSTSWARQNGSSTESRGIGAEHERAALVRRVLARRANASSTIQKPSRRRMRLRLVDQRAMRRQVVRPVAQPDASVAARRVTRLSSARQILRHRQPVDAARHPRTRRPTAGSCGTTVCAITPCVRPCDWICPSGYGVSRAREVEVVDRDRLLEHRRRSAGTDGSPASSSPGAPCSGGRRARTSSRARRDACRSPIAAAAPPS